MAKTLKDIIGGVPLSGTIQAITNGIPDDAIPAEFLRVTRKVKGDVVKFKEVDGTRKTARQVHYGSPSRNTNNITGVRERIAKMIHSYEHIQHDMAVLEGLQSTDPMLRNAAEAQVAFETEVFNARFSNLRLASIYSMLGTGKIVFDGDGNLLDPNGSGDLVIDAGVPAGNRDQLDALGTGDLISASWSIAGTAIHTDIRKIKKAARRLTGYKLQEAFYGENILDFFLTNNKMKELINRHTDRSTTAIGGEIPDGVMGLRWTPFDDLFFEAEDGTIVEIITSDTVIFTPAPSPEWWEIVEGSFQVPTDVGSVGADAVAQMGTTMPVNGMFSYAVTTIDPVGVRQFAGDTMLPLMKVPKAIFIADVTP